MKAYFQFNLWIAKGNESQIITRSNIFNNHFYLPEVNIKDQNGRGVHSRLVPCLKIHGTSLLNIPWSFWTCICTSGFKVILLRGDDIGSGCGLF